MYRNLTVAAVAAIAFCSFGAASAADSDYYKTEVQKAEAQYDSAIKQCDSLAGNDKDVCVKRAKADLEIAKADIRAYEKNTSAEHMKAYRERIKQEYGVAKEKCDVFAGNAKDVCLKQAEATKMRREGNLTALESQLKGEYAVSKEKCESLSGDAKSACKDEAKRTYKP